jgi:high-affinity iron transporter
VLPTFVIGLREGLEASLIVGIVAAFAKRNGRAKDMWALWVGVAIAVTLCALVAIGLRIAEQNLPQKQQEGLETIVGLIAVSLVTWMVVWMRSHARTLKGDLELHAAEALAAGSAWALIIMAFLAVLREGFETSVFLLAAFQASTNPLSAGIGAALGIAVAVVIGYAVYKGGVKLNLARFFKITGVVLVLVAAGLLSMAVHTAHEAGWLDAFQSQAINLRWLIDPGSVRAALITGMFGLQPEPTFGEIFVWLAYAIPMTAFVLWPQGTRQRKPESEPVAAAA